MDIENTNFPVVQPVPLVTERAPLATVRGGETDILNEVLLRCRSQSRNTTEVLLVGFEGRLLSVLQASLQLSRVAVSRMDRINTVEFTGASGNLLVFARYAHPITGEIFLNQRKHLNKCGVPVVALFEAGQPMPGQSFDNEIFFVRESDRTSAPLRESEAKGSRTGARELSPDFIHSCESAFIDIGFHPFFAEEAARLHDRAVLSSDTYNGYSLARLLAEQLNCAFDLSLYNLIDTINPCRWPSAVKQTNYRTDKSFGTIFIAAPLLLADAFPELFRKSVRLLHRHQFGE